MKKIMIMMITLLMGTSKPAHHVYHEISDMLEEKKVASAPCQKKIKKPIIPSPLSSPDGRAYYESLIEKASKRHWAVQTSVYYSFDDGAFDCCGCSGPLSALVFGKDPITIKDIYLFSKLSDDNKVRINNCDARAPERGGVPIGGTGVPFGGFRDDLYTTLLAPVELIFDADQKEVGFLASGMFRFALDHNDTIFLTFGFTVPFKSKKHTLGLTHKNGELFRRGFVPDSTQRETSLKQFFREFSDVEDFILSAVFAPKGLTFECNQRKTGFGDFTLFTAFDFNIRTNYLLQIGFNIVFPTAGKGDGCTVWEPILGNGGAYQFNPFIQFISNTSVPYLNPFVRLAAEASSTFATDTTRVPTLITNATRTQVKNVAGLSAPETFQDFYVDPFSEFDSCVPLLAAKKPCINKKIGTKVLFGLGNYAYRIFNVDLRWGIFYDFFYKGKDSFNNDGVKDSCDCPVIDVCTMEKCTDQRSHIISTNLTYKFTNLFELSAGGSFTVLGKNVTRERSFYVSFVAVF